MQRIVIIDADSIPYMASYVAERDNLRLKEVHKIVDNIIESIMSATKANKYVAFITGKFNFRYKVYIDYKSNRDRTRTQNDFFEDAKEYMIIKWKCYIVNGAEADDACVILHQRFKNSILAGIDKDLLQSPGLHYNYRDKTLKQVSSLGTFNTTINGKIKSTGKMKLYHQMLEGDIGDSIPGITGIGPKKACNLLYDAKNEYELERRVRKIYNYHYGKILGNISFTNNFKLLYMPLHSSTMITPPPVKYKKIGLKPNENSRKTNKDIKLPF